MALRLWCSGRVEIDRLALVVPAIHEETIASCTPAAPTELAIIFAADDSVVPPSGFARRSGYLSQEKWVRAAVELNGCRWEGSNSELFRNNLESDRWARLSECSLPTSVVNVFDSQHTWPGGPVSVPGTEQGEFPTSRWMLAEPSDDVQAQQRLDVGSEFRASSTR